jgi:glycosyltransferase involved in cell wall biosynthesis
VCTYNSSETLETCLASIRRVAPSCRLIVVDHNSEDSTQRIADSYGAEVYLESVGLGFARQICFDLVQTKYLAFVDSDVEIVKASFFELALKRLESPNNGAVVGMAVGHKLAYGLPASLLVLRKQDFPGKVFPDYIDARETHFIQRRLNELGLRTAYVFDSMIHRSQFRKYKPEWEGANTRILKEDSVKELLFALKVVAFMSLNSKNFKNIVYAPVFYLKFLRGFANPAPWLRLKRVRGDTHV